MNLKIALVEDNCVLRHEYSEILKKEGFEVETFDDRHEAMNQFKIALPDVVILDVSLKDERDGGFQLCAQLRQRAPKLPIIFLTSRTEEFDRISGLRVGADDYVPKDVGINYVIVRIEALFKRVREFLNAHALSAQNHTNTQVYGSLELDETRKLVKWKNVPINLSLTQFWILKDLATAVGEIRNYSKLMKAANITVEPNTVAAHIKAIRNHFKSSDIDFDCIRTERGCGYRWVEV